MFRALCRVKLPPLCRRMQSGGVSVGRCCRRALASRGFSEDPFCYRKNPTWNQGALTRAERPCQGPLRAHAGIAAFWGGP